MSDRRSFNENEVITRNMLREELERYRNIQRQEL